MKLYVMRHGVTKCNEEHKYNGRLDEDINNKGINQAKEARNIVKNLDIDLIISSPLLRTRHTCRIANVNNIDVIYDDRLMERDCGILTDKDLGEFYYTDYWNYYSSKKVEDLESIQDLFLRVKLFLDELKEKYRDKNILVKFHNTLIKKSDIISNCEL